MAPYTGVCRFPFQTNLTHLFTHFTCKGKSKKYIYLYAIAILVVGTSLFSDNFLVSMINVSVHINVFTVKWHKLTPWQFTPFGDWLRERKWRHKNCQEICLYFDHLSGWLNFWESVLGRRLLMILLLEGAAKKCYKF